MARILIVEDEILLAMSLQAELEALGHEVIGIAEGSDKTFSLIETGKPDLILMDIVLHGRMSGIEITIAVNEKYKIPVIYRTAHSDRMTIENANKTRHFGILSKQHDAEVLREVVQKALEH